ncbi:hypothetical protein L9F63_014524 [Diploptera punctata]|uniref:Endonuclease V n=1 Tax=Diploptera punctata TaxID=6984 RepID=A0AAD8A974_DIPPU|nr:hypothetical protein L9F63_014524 [Diploptera punctata]
MVTKYQSHVLQLFCYVLFRDSKNKTYRVTFINRMACEEESKFQSWIIKQEELKSKVIRDDIYEWQQKRKDVQKIGGMDLSFIKEKDSIACAALVVCQFPDFEVIYEDISMVPMTVPYIPGFLGFREAPPLVEAFARLRNKEPHLVPDCILVDGNGTLHPRGFGLASHIGVCCNIPTVGVAKNLYQMEDLGLLRNEDHKQKISEIKNPGDHFDLETTSGTILGLALKTSASSSKPVYVSIGHMFSLQTAAWIVYHCSKYRIPEPIRQADIRSREFLRINREKIADIL